MTNTNGIRAEVAAEQAAASFDAATTEPDLSTYYSLDRAAALLGLAPRTFREKLQLEKLTVPKFYRPREGKKAEVCFRPDDIEREAEKTRAKAVTVFAPDSGVGPQLARRSEVDTLDIIDRFSSAMIAALAPGQQRQDRGKWLTVKAASRVSGLSLTLMARVVRYMVDQQNPDAVYDGGLKVRHAAVGELTAALLREATEAHEARRKEKTAARENAAADLAAVRPIAAGAKVGGR